MKTHKRSTRPKSVECAYCEYANEKIADKPHYPAPLGAPKWVLRLMNMHRWHSDSRYYSGAPIPVCLTCKTIMGDAAKWPCDTALIIAHGLNDEEEKENKEPELRAFGVIATGKNLI